LNEEKRTSNKTKKKRDEMRKLSLNLIEPIPPICLKDFKDIYRNKWRGCQRLFEKKKA
jgi:5-methylthioribose kinase